MAPSGHRRNLPLHKLSSRNSTGDSSTNKIGRTKHCSVWYNQSLHYITVHGSVRE